MVSRVHNAWRIAQHTTQFSAEDLSGRGARETGGRWNSKGKAAVYAASTIALATLETLAHLGSYIAIRNVFLEEYNLLINPAHPASRKITAAVTRQYIYDPRLQKAK
jgi:hypothetical protein